jgi:hypothetical protein
VDVPIGSVAKTINGFFGPKMCGSAQCDVSVVSIGRTFAVVGGVAVVSMGKAQ